MTIINAKDLDQQMGRTIDPNSVPRHNGADQGVLQEIDQAIVERGGGRRGAAVFSEREVGEQFVGSKTVISVNDAPPIPEQMDPRAQAAKKVAAVAPPMPPPAAAAPVAQRPRSPQEVLAAMGLAKPKA